MKTIKFKLVDGLKGKQSFMLINSKKQYRKFDVEPDYIYSCKGDDNDKLIYEGLKNYSTKIPFNQTLYEKLQENKVKSNVEICNSCGGRRSIKLNPIEVWYEDN